MLTFGRTRLAMRQPFSITFGFRASTSKYHPETQLCTPRLICAVVEASKRNDNRDQVNECACVCSASRREAASLIAETLKGNLHRAGPAIGRQSLRRIATFRFDRENSHV